VTYDLAFDPEDKPDVRLNMRRTQEALVCRVTVGEAAAVA